jgi:hypothetical protein
MLKVATSHEAHRDDLPLTLGYSLYPLLSLAPSTGLFSPLYYVSIWQASVNPETTLTPDIPGL